MKPPDPFTARPATPADAEVIAAVFNACEEAHVPEPSRIGEREVSMWQERALATAVVTDEHGHVVGCGGATLRGGALSTECRVVPSLTGLGIGSFLLDWAEEQARNQAEALRASVLAGDERARELVSTRGFRHVRSFYQMVIDLDGPPPPPRWPEGITVARFQEGEERLLHDVIEDSFAENWGHVPRSFEEWLPRMVIEPDLIFVARERDQAVGAVVCNEHLFGAALVGILGVRKPWRGRGLGRALLLQGFAALYDKGKLRIGLGVDAGNETGAVRLYESVGMRVGAQDDVYERRM